MISLVVSCMNRTNNLCHTLESWIDQSKLITDILLIDWSSNPSLKSNSFISDLINRQKINIVEVIDEPFFSVPKASNLAFNKINTTNEYLIKIDSDYQLLDPYFINNKVLDINNSFLRGPNKSHYTGFLAIEKKNFLYYNENFVGWGYEDLDLYSRLKNNIQEIMFTDIEKYIYHIPHPDSDSVANYSIKNKARSEKNNRLLASESFTISKYETIYKTDCYERVKRIC